MIIIEAERLNAASLAIYAAAYVAELRELHRTKLTRFGVDSKGNVHYQSDEEMSSAAAHYAKSVSDEYLELAKATLIVSGRIS